MVQVEKIARKRKTSAPSEGYVCSICNKPGHWIQQCPEKRQKKKKNSKHIHTPGVDPSQADIDKAREMQKLKPPNCFCGITSRLKKVKRSKEDENSRAIGKYFFFCAKTKFDESKCRFARPVEDHLKPKKERICTFFAKTGSCKKGDKCMFSHEKPEKSDGKLTSASDPDIKDHAETTATHVPEEENKGKVGGDDSSSDSSDSGDSSDSSDSSDSCEDSE
jgi:hypothetical protein